jgi:UDP-3-O-[3-hydroxymyristoyl] glucosamine N-acyltransferase
MSAPSITVEEIEELLGMPSSGDRRAFSRLAGFADAGPEAIVFAKDEAALERALAGTAGLVLAPEGAPLRASEGAPLRAVHEGDVRVLRVKDPKYAFAVCGRRLDSFVTATIHPMAVIAPGADVGEGTAIGAGCVVEAGAILGERCVLAANVTVYGCCELGDGVLVQAGAVLGAMGFGYVRGEDGRYVRFPQQGRLVIEDDVEIGANTTIDRGALGETRIGAGTKIDNQVHIGHNCAIGKDVVIAAQVGISGSCVVGDGVVMAGQVGLGDHVTIGPGVILGGASGVFPGKRLDGPGQMFMGVPAEPLKDYLKSVARVRRLKDRG